jgi:hypothetical protein
MLKFDKGTDACLKTVFSRPIRILFMKKSHYFFILPAILFAQEKATTVTSKQSGK